MKPKLSDNDINNLWNITESIKRSRRNHIDTTYWENVTFIRIIYKLLRSEVSKAHTYKDPIGILHSDKCLACLVDEMRKI